MKAERRLVLASGLQSALAVAGVSLFNVAIAKPEASEQAAQWQALRKGGHVLFIRHALAPGTFDPPGFKLEVCSSQRNLSDEGRAQARLLGNRFVAEKVPIDEVHSSEWCRCMDTAKLAFESGYGKAKIKAWQPLNSPSQQQPEQRLAATQVIREEMLRWFASPSARTHNRVFVTHMFKIADLLGENSGVGEVMVTRLEQGSIKLVARLG